MKSHDKTNEEVICPVCSKQFKNARALQKHKKFVHTDEFKFNCSYCDKQFKRKKAVVVS